MNDNKSLIPNANQEDIKNMIYIVRGKQVMIDNDLALLYCVETKAMNRQMKRNIERFPEDFCFQLTKEELDDLRNQNSTLRTGNYGGRRYMPYVFTEHGILMMASVLQSDIAIKVSIQIIKMFVEMRRANLPSNFMLDQITDLKVELTDFERETDKKFEQVFDFISTHAEENQKIFFDGQVYDAYSLLISLVLKAEKEIILIDGYVDTVTLDILCKKSKGVKVIIYTHDNSIIKQSDIDTFNRQYPTLKIKHTNAFHDRFLLIDKKIGYHIGASLKDAGKKCFAINKLLDEETIQDILKRLV